MHTVRPADVVRLLVSAILMASCTPRSAGESERTEADARVAQQLERVSERLTAIRGDLIEFRRDIHRHPELAGQEKRTAQLVADRLRSLGLEVRTGVGGHGVVGVLRGSKSGRVVAFRADMDAVGDGGWIAVSAAPPDPVPFRSETPGAYHLCGHDIHVAVAMGVAEALAPMRDAISGSVKFIFQPAEETVEGARAMISDGVLEGPAPEAIFMVHTHWLPVGQIGLVSGMVVPGLEPFVITASGSGDTEAAAKALAASIVGMRSVGPEYDPKSAVTGEFIYPYASARQDTLNDWIISGVVKASGDEAYTRARDEIRRQIARATLTDVSFEVRFLEPTLPATINDSSLLRRSRAPIRAVAGGEGLVQWSGAYPPFSEDFALYQQSVPGVLFFLGVSNPDIGISAMPHTSDFVADEGAIFVGARAMSAVLLDYLAAQE